MNPGIFVLGGGGDGGGSGGGDGKGNGKGQGAKGQNGGNDANGGGNGAGACGAGAGGACSNCGHNIAAGDPVDVTTGNVFTIPKRDLLLPGLFELAFVRNYSARHSDVDKGLGYGWTHTFAAVIEERRSTLVLRASDGARMSLPRPKEPGEAMWSGSWGVQRHGELYSVRPGDEFIHYFAEIEPGSAVYKLVAVHYRNRGHISLHYENGRLSRAVDSVGRTILFESTREGRISSISVPSPNDRTIVFARYAYDVEGNLISATDAEGHVTRYSYDDDHRLVRLEYPSGLTFHFRYNSSGLCLETWGEHPGGFDPALSPDVPKVLADGKTPAKGIFHCVFEYDPKGEYSEVVDSVRLQRFFAGPKDQVGKAVDARGGVTTRTFDEHGRITSLTDPTEATWTYEYDWLDNLIHEKDPEGREIRIQRDEVGRPVEMIDPEGGAVKLVRDLAGEVIQQEDQNGGVTSYQRDSRSLIVGATDARGGKRTFEYDSHANLVAYTTATGGRYEMTWDYWGRCLSERDPMGNLTRYVHSDRGYITTVIDALGQTRQLAYDSMGNLVRETMPDGTTEEAVYGGLNWRASLRRADGTELRTHYNREGWPVRLTNERGETWEFERTQTGRVASEKDFIGRVTRYKHDALGRVISIDEAGVQWNMTLNKVGQVVKIETSDDTVQTFEHNARGDLLRATSGDVAFEWKHDRAGNVVSEVFEIGGAKYAVDSTRGPSGDRRGVRTSLGHALDLRRDAAGAVSEIWSGNERVLAITRDLNGSRVRRDLPNGGVMQDAYDPLHRVVRRSVTGPGQARVAAGEPEWMGRSGGVDRVFEYTPVDEVRSVSSADGTVLEYSYDLRRHVVERRKNQVRDVELRADATDNYHEAGGVTAKVRSYGVGGQLVRWGEYEYAYDGRGFLIEKRRMIPGATAPEVTRYEWDAWGMLSAVALPDGGRVEFAYDPFARRVQKRIRREGRVVASHHYVWDLKTMVHDIMLDADGKPADVSTYLFEDNEDILPIGHREDSRWLYYVNDVTGAPDEIVDGAGALVAKMERTIFGRTRVAWGATSSVMRFAGQHEDAETGLHYNRYRYYDPDTGRYMSPDPIGLSGQISPYAYCPNPVGWVDPIGWQHGVTTQGFGGPAPNAASGNPTAGFSYDSQRLANCPIELSHGNQMGCHSEQKFAYDLLNSGQTGGNYSLNNGTLPPCPNCHGAMMRAANATNSTITYNWSRNGQNNSVTYHPNGTTTYSPTPAGQALQTGYSGITLNPPAGQPWTFNPPGTPVAQPNTMWGATRPVGTRTTYLEAQGL